MSCAADDAVPPPPPLSEQEAGKPALPQEDGLEPEVVIVPKKDAVHEEYRIKGRLYMIKVTPKVGKPYYLIDKKGLGDFTRTEMESNISVPLWVIKEF